MKIVRPMSLFAQRLEIRSLGAGHGLIAAHPIVRVFLGVRAGVGFRIVHTSEMAIGDIVATAVRDVIRVKGRNRQAVLRGHSRQRCKIYVLV